ncbi:MAG: AI-2E family transporter [Clostridiaceae bacterium]|mgnify:CR=1 FL=1|nr:AI-2E family transporter [Clostridiaceae bacterium]
MKKIGPKLKGYFLLITYAILLYLAVSNIKSVLAFLSTILVVLSPFIIGIVFAYVLNIIMGFFERHLFNKLTKSKKPFIRKLQRPLSILVTFTAVLIFLTIITLFMVPQLSESILTLKSNMSGYLESLNKFINNLADKYNLTGDIWNEISLNWNEILNKSSQFISAAIPQIYTFTKNLTNGIINIIMGVIVSIYLLAQKEKLIRIMKQFLYAFTPKETATKIVDTGIQANKTFQDFIAGQATEALILGALVLLGMLIFNFPYAVLCSVIIAVTALIPIFGAWIGTIPCVFIILMAQPQKAFWFIVFIVILQQLENNLIYPRVVGNSIGLDGLWVLFSLIVGGSLFGLAGMLVGVPTFAVLYMIIRRITNRKLKEKNIVIS